MDPPEHSRLRRILQPVFTPRSVRALVESVRENCRDIVDELAAGPPQVDLVLAASAELPLRVLADMLGVPGEDRHLMFLWSNTLVGLADPEYGVPQDESVQVLGAMLDYGARLAEERRARPRDDLISLICAAKTDDGERLSDVELSMFWLLLVIAGNETTWQPTSSCAMSRQCCTSAAPPRPTSCSTISTYGRATRSSCGMCQPTETPRSSRLQMSSAWAGARTVTWPSASVPTSAWVRTSPDSSSPRC
jgi:hypothetical protein